VTYGIHDRIRGRRLSPCPGGRIHRGNAADLSTDVRRTHGAAAPARGSADAPAQPADGARRVLCAKRGNGTGVDSGTAHGGGISAAGEHADATADAAAIPGAPADAFTANASAGDAAESVCAAAEGGRRARIL